METRRKTIVRLLEELNIPRTVSRSGCGFLSELKIQFMKRLIECALNVELEEHLGYTRGNRSNRRRPNSRNGTHRKVVTSEYGKIALDIPRDRESTFQPILLPKHERNIVGFCDISLCIYATSHLDKAEVRDAIDGLYDANIPYSLLNKITDSILSDVAHWRNRLLAPMWAILLFDSIDITLEHLRQSAQTIRIHLIVGIGWDGYTEILSMWTRPKTELTANNTAANDDGFLLEFISDLARRGVRDVSFAVGTNNIPDLVSPIRLFFSRAIIEE